MLNPSTRARADRLTALLAREKDALVDFLRELSDFDAQECWKEFGYTSLFDFLHRELGLAKSSAFDRKTAARLVTRFPAVADALREGKLCISAVNDLSKVLTEQNCAEVLPRFFRLGRKEAGFVAAALCPQESPPLRPLVTAVPAITAALAPPPASKNRSEEPASWHQPVRAANSSTTLPGCVAAPAPRSEVEPVSADLRRLHLTVSQSLLDKVKEAQALRSHAHPGESLEKTLEAAVELLLASERKKKALVEKPRPAPPPRPTPEPGCRDARHVPAAIEREVRLRDQGKCQYRLVSGEICGSTHQVELHHTTNWADGGAATVDDLSLRCRRHNRAEAERDFGDGLIDACTRRQRERRREQPENWNGEAARATPPREPAWPQS